MKNICTYFACLLGVFSLSQLGASSASYVSQNQIICSNPKFEVRAYCGEVPIVQIQLESLGAKLQSQYSFTDDIYYPISQEKPANYDSEFIRLRNYHETHWDQKNVEVVHKIKNTADSRDPNFRKLQFDDIGDARDFLRNNYKLDISFYRDGYEYRLGDMRVYLEMIRSLKPTIEVIASSEKEILDLFDKLHIADRVNHSVPTLVKLNCFPLGACMQ